MKHIVEHYPQAHTIHLVMDNLNIHCRQSLVTHFGEGKGGSVWDRFTNISVKPLPSGMGRKGDSPVAGDRLFRSILVGSMRVRHY